MMQYLIKMNKQKNYMKTLLFTLLLFCVVQGFHAQENSQYRIISSNIGSGGSSQSVQTSKGTYKVSQSIGQSSVIGTHQSNGYYLRQGYQQPLSTIKTSSDFNYSLMAKVFPNPFDQEIMINFSSRIKDDISVQIFDINTKIIHFQEFLPAQQIRLRIKDISRGTYFLKVYSDGKYFNTKLIKI